MTADVPSERGSEMRALVMDAPGSLALERRPVPHLHHDDVLVRTAYVGVCGTDLHLLDGTMPYLAAGYLAYPFTFGHEYSGVIEAVGPAVDGLAPGDRVVGHCMVPCGRCEPCQRGARQLCRHLHEVGLRFIDGAAADFVRVPAGSVTVIPADLALDTAALVEPGVTGYRACVRARVAPGDQVAVLGTSTMGLLSGMFARDRGAEVTMLGVDDQELSFAASTAGFPRAERVESAALEAFDVVIETTGSAQALHRAVELSAPGGRLSLIGIPGADSRVDQSAVVLKDLEIFGILHGIDHYVDVVDVYASGRVRPEVLIGETVAPSDAPALFASLASGAPRRAPKSLIDFSR